MALNKTSFFKNRSFLQLFIISSLALLVIISSIHLINSSEPINNTKYRKKILSSIKKDNDFASFTKDLFKYEVTSNSVITAYTLNNPKNYDIPDLTPILSDFSAKVYRTDSEKETSKKTVSELSKKLSTYSYNNLSVEDKITYELLEKHFKLNEEFCNYSYYETLLGKTNGAASSLPVTLSEYPIKNRTDIETYLNLLQQIPDYFDNVIEYEKDRKSKGISTPIFILIDTEKELSKFIKTLDNDKNCFSSTFIERIYSIPDLTTKERIKYISLHKYYVNQYIIPAYTNIYTYIKNNINETLPSNTATKSEKTTLSQSQSKNLSDLPEKNTAYGLSAFPEGKEYYVLLSKDVSGSYRPISELIEMTENSLNRALSDVLYIATTHPEAYIYYCDHPVETGFHSPEGILEALSLMIREDYPLLDITPSYKIKTVPDVMAEMVSPAYYMIPQIDDYNNNIIYINPQYTNEDNGNLFTTLAHEGFPGHLYQTVYYNSTSPNPLRQILDYPGYVEGWATYVELNSFSFIDYPKYSESLPTLYRSDTIINLALSSRIDMGVNYENWTLADTCKYFEDLGFNSYYASDIYTYVVEAPGNYLSYFIGYLEIENLKQEYKNLKMENYNEQDFHKALLDIGPADFETIEKYLLR